MSRTFWHDLVTRAARNAVQVMIPFFILASTGQITSAGVIAVTVAALLAAATSALKTLGGLTVTTAAPLWLQVLERAVAAAAGAVAGQQVGRLLDFLDQLGDALRNHRRGGLIGVVRIGEARVIPG